ncbi:MAG: DUF4347 domain-containing protein, partial [Cyanobacteria bacterium J06592_8]
MNIIQDSKLILSPAHFINSFTLFRQIKSYCQVIFIDPQVEDFQYLISGVTAEAVVVVLDATQDGIKQITQCLSHHQLSEIHIVSHGAPGCLSLGASQLSLDTFDRYAQALSQWSVDSIFLYGCNIAAGDAGTEFIEKLHYLTGAEIAASTTKIGHMAKGGNWNLDCKTSEFEAIVAFNTEVQNQWSHVLMAISLTLDPDNDNGTPTDTSDDGSDDGNFETTFTEGDGGIRIADSDMEITSTNNLTGATITLTNPQPGDTFTVGTLPAGISSNLDTSDPNQIVLTLSGTASADVYEQAIVGNGAISFAHLTDNPSNTDRQITIAVTDGVETATQTTTVQVVPVNDPPTVDLDGNTPSESTVSNNSVSGVEPAVTGTITNGASSASYTLTRTQKSGGDNEVNYVAGNNGIETKNNNFTGNGDSFTYEFDVTPANGTTVEGVSLYRVGYTTGGNEESSSLTLTWTGGVGVISDPDDQIENYDDGDIILSGAILELRFPGGTQDGSSPNEDSTWRVDIESDNLTVNVVDDNSDSVQLFNEWLTFDATLNQSRDFTTTFTENDLPVSIADTDAFTEDVDNTNLESATVTFTNPQTDDRIVIDSTPVASGDSGTVNGIAYTVSTGTNGEIIVSLTGSATQADYTNALKLITFENTSDDPITTPNRVFEVTVNDGDMDSEVAITTIEVIPVNTNPAAVDDTATVNENSIDNIIDVLNNDTFGTDGPSTGTISLATNPSNGTAVVNNNNTPNDPTDDKIEYTPNANYNGSDSFTYTITDQDGETSTATVNVRVNAPPDAVNDSETTNEDTSVTTTVLTNDTDLDGDTLTVTGATNGTNGTTTVNADGTITYTPNSDFHGTDTYTYTISDGNGGTDTATVTVTINPVNDEPDAVNDSETTNEDTSVTTTVLTNDT